MLSHTGTCAHCGDEFTRTRSKGAAPKYCEDYCRDEARRLRRGSTSSRRTEISFRFADCIYCDSLFIQRREVRKYCNAEDCVRRFNADRQNRFYHDYKDRTGRQPVIGARRAHDARRRSSKLDPVIEIFDPYEVFDADGWVCQLCGGPVDPDLRAPDQYSVSLDHIVPMEHGGDHVRENVQTAHLTCNVAKGNQQRHIQMT